MDAGWVQLIVTVVSMVFVSGITVGVVQFQARETQRRIGAMELEMKQMQQILINQATQQMRLNTMDERLNAQGGRLDKLTEHLASEMTKMAHMVGACISRMNNFIDDIAIDRRNRSGDDSKLIGS